jgi:hypothetical protein
LNTIAKRFAPAAHALNLQKNLRFRDTGDEDAQKKLIQPAVWRLVEQALKVEIEPVLRGIKSSPRQ